MRFRGLSRANPNQYLDCKCALKNKAYFLLFDFLFWRVDIFIFMVFFLSVILAKDSWFGGPEGPGLDDRGTVILVWSGDPHQPLTLCRHEIENRHHHHSLRSIHGLATPHVFYLAVEGYVQSHCDKSPRAP